MAKSIHLKVPASTANLGPGFDTLGLALDIYLQVDARLEEEEEEGSAEGADSPLAIKVSYRGNDEASISLDPVQNMVTATMLDMLRIAGSSAPPDSQGQGQQGRRRRRRRRKLAVSIDNPIPLGRGLGSSGAAIVAGVLLANWVGELNWPRQKMLERCTVIEGHPDNVGASLLGGFVASYMAPEDKVFTLQLPFDHENVSVFAVIPDYHVPTHLARAALPKSYSLKEVVHSVQRATVISHLLGNPAFTASGEHLNGEVFGHALDDVVHQPHRAHLLPGFLELRSALRQDADVLGVFVSGAGPTVLILARKADSFSRVARVAHDVYTALPHPERAEGSAQTVKTQILHLRPCGGAEVSEHNGDHHVAN